MIGLPKPGERVTFSAAEGHRVPCPGRPGAYYRAGEPVTETWTYQHHARLQSGALVLHDWPSKPQPQPEPGAQPAASPELEPPAAPAPVAQPELVAPQPAAQPAAQPEGT